MNYTPPKDEHGNSHYVPVVAKNRDFLIGYLKGIDTAKDIIHEVLESVSIDVDLGPLDVVLDSTRFNDILENGKHESEMSEEELKEYIYGIVEEVTNKIDSANSENNIYDDDLLRLECSCGFSFASWDQLEDIPTENYCCSNCGKVLIHYTGHYGYEYEYDEGVKDDTEKD